ncbi:ATP-dependent zinc metalloprotease FtsH [Botrimarina colliarenosi]|uniref:ATP-dependent zinc metalloprotease FtsH n=1 Tax=Botrimarina colliarenosi TaxID=2528001 RepID=A0A5C6ALR1_9BACT|nr:ATP-dependent zinc metalloprotease FtsH [Botrimarina colliarenosi]TWU00570.1 ATP-dependent zinc metalloprotease FtsH [Botrimarina colliarenosi]
MEKQPNPSNSDKRGGDGKKPGSQPVSFVWYLLAVFVLLMLGVTLFGSSTTVTLPWSEFVRLAEASYRPPAAGDATADDATPAKPAGPGSIVYVDRTLDPERMVRLSNLGKLVVGYDGVSGRVTRQVFPAGATVPATTTTGDDATGDAPAETAENDVRFRVNWNPNLPRVGELLESNGLTYTAAQPDSPLLAWLPTLLMMALLVGLMVYMLRRLGGAGSPMAFGRSRGKLYAQEDLEVTFDDVAGIDEAVEELREVVDFLKNPERYQRLGGRIPKGVLLVGPPGTGKTLLSKAVAGEAGVPFFSLSGSDFVEMFVGVGAARVRDMFQQAEQRAPCIVFIDELDALGKTRGNGQMGSHDEREQTLNALLVEMDGFGSNSGIIIMGATNRPETLDPALLRPGRFDRNVLVDRPDVAGRKQILEVHLANVKVSDEVDVDAIAAITSGFVGADLANTVNEAALLAARNGKEMVGKEEFYEAVERASIGLEKKSRIMLDEEKHRLAVHEGGHALVAYSLPNTDPVHKVSIIPRGLSALGYMQQRPEADRYMVTKTQLESQLQVMLAGTLAEELIFDDVGTGASNDLDRATEVARSMVMDYGMSRLGRVTYRERTTGFLGHDAGYSKHHSEQTAREIDQEVKRIIDEGLEQTRRILATRRPALEAITAELLEKEVIDAEKLGAIIEQASPGPKIVPGTGNERKAATPPTKPATDDEAAEG